MPVVRIGGSPSYEFTRLRRCPERGHHGHDAHSERVDASVASWFHCVWRSFSDAFNLSLSRARSYIPATTCCCTVRRHLRTPVRHARHARRGGVCPPQDAVTTQQRAVSVVARDSTRVTKHVQINN